MKRLLLALLLLGAAFRAEAVDYTDVWFNASQPGYGFTIVETDDGTASPFVFVLFFVYGSNGAPTWYSAELRWNGTDTFTGPLYANVGTFFGVPWIPANLSQVKVGTASFAPNPANNYQGTISYTATGVGSSTTAISRLTLTRIETAGSYGGTQSGSYSGCNTPANNYAYQDPYGLEVTDNADGSVTYTFDFYSGISCQLTGTYVQHGQYYTVPSAAYTCSDGTTATAQLTEIRRTSLGLEGRLTAPGEADNCTENAVFGGPRQ